MGNIYIFSSPSKRQTFLETFNYWKQKDLSGGGYLAGPAGELTLKPEEQKKWRQDGVDCTV